MTITAKHSFTLSFHLTATTLHLYPTYSGAIALSYPLGLELGLR